MNNKKFFLLLGLATLLFATSCDDDDDTIYGNWVEGAQFDGNKRGGAVSFTITTDDGNETVYMGLGYNGSKDSESQYFSDFYSYSGGSSWTEQAPFPGDARQDLFGFAINNKGYIGCGYYGDTAEIYFSDVWEFDPAADSASQWTQIADFPGGELTDLTSFVVNGKAYVTGGRYDYDGTRKDCYEFDPESKTFTKIGGMNYKRAGAFSFVIGNKAYVGGGYDSPYYVSQMECFDGETGEWLENGSLRALQLISDITDDIDEYDDAIDLRRRYATTFVVDGKGYITAGIGNSGILSDCWEYDPSTDIWTEKNDFEYNMISRYKANGFVLNGIPYMLAGQSGTGYLDDMWYFEPDEESDETD